MVHSRVVGQNQIRETLYESFFLISLLPTAEEGREREKGEGKEGKKKETSVDTLGVCVCGGGG